MGFIDYLKETRAELKHVSWPTRKQAVGFTAMVIVLSFLTAALLGLFDTALGKLLAVLRSVLGN